MKYHFYLLSDLPPQLETTPTVDSGCCLLTPHSHYRNGFSEEQALLRRTVAVPHSMWEQWDDKGNELDPNRARWTTMGCYFEPYPVEDGYVYCTSSEEDAINPWPGLFDHSSD